MALTVIYCYDAYCGWCYGFSPVMGRMKNEYRNTLFFEVYSGGMIRPDEPKHIGLTAGYIKSEYPRVEELTGVKFGNDYLWHVRNPEESDWYPDSLLPATALCIFKEYYPDIQVEIATELQYALHFEGRDLCDKEAYRHLLEKYAVPADEFFSKLDSEEFKEQASYEFALVKQLQVTGFPTVLLQADEGKFYLLCRGYTDYETINKRLVKVLNELGS